MLKQHSRKAVFIVMMILAMFGMVGCDSKDEKAAKKIVEVLQEKYSKEFVVDSLGGGWGTMNSNTLKAIVYPKDEPTMKVLVEITKDLKQVYDNYLNHVVARAAEKPIEQIANSIWGESRVEVTNDTGMTYPEHTDTNMSYEQFLTLYPMNYQLVSVYLNSDSYINDDGDMNLEGEMEKYRTFAKKLVEEKYRRSSVYINYITPDGYERFDEASRSDRSIDGFYREEEEKLGTTYIATVIGYELDDQGVITTTKEEFEQNYEVWKEERLKSR